MTMHRLLFGISIVFVLIGLFLFVAEGETAMLLPTLFFGGCAAVGWMQLREGRARTGGPAPALDGPEIVLRRGNGAMRLYAIASIAMGLGGGAMMFQPGIVPAIIGAAALLFFGGGGFLLLHRQRGGPSLALRADAAGIGFGEGTHPAIPWRDLEEMGVLSIAGQRQLGFTLREGSTSHAARGTVSKVNAGLDLPDYALGQIGLTVPLEQVEAALRRLRSIHA